jgi:hypothetical protein
MAAREELVRYLNAVLVGPGLGKPHPELGIHNEKITGRLSLAYAMGMLYAIPSDSGDALDIDPGLDVDDVDGDDEETDPLSMAGTAAPSAMGISVCISNASILEIIIRAAVYKPSEKASHSDQTWEREQLSDSVHSVGEGGLPRTAIFGGLADLEVLARALENDCSLLTISVCNRQQAAGKKPDLSKALFQVSISCSPKSGAILPYPSSRFIPPTAEERELRLIYGEQRPFAAGHGVAADWTVIEGKCTGVCTSAFPLAHVWRPRFDSLRVGPGADGLFVGEGIFDLPRLSYMDFSPKDLADRLLDLIVFYERWIKSQQLIEVEDELRQDAQVIIGRCEQSADRMRAGIELLRTDKIAYEAFALANRAMMMSMCHAARATGRGRTDGRQGPFPLGEADLAPIDYKMQAGYAWRPFQIAFMLQLLPSLMHSHDPDREIVDVIWFATGGGKTEAYLFAAAFELIRRRLVDGARGGGTAVMNRYTYQFLTADQFQRTAGMICALELIRREFHAKGDQRLGGSEFSIGLFAGEKVSPNKIASGFSSGAFELCTALLESKQPRTENPFPIESCPCCGTLLVPDERAETPDGFVDKAFYGFSSTANSFVTKCPEESCPFHPGLPISFIDEQLYRSPPSFLLGTIDKFAMIPWTTEAGRLLGVGTKFNPPSLIIQDELHLISGPLGTLAGIYEAAFETVMSTVGNVRPKVVGSTATIRNAASQCRRIYGRETSIFPSPGIRAKDSFFATLDEGEFSRSRLYVGFMAQGVRPTVAVSWAIAAVLQGVQDLDIRGQLDDKERDSYWTLMAYHNSKRELGRITNATRDEIPSRVQVYASQSIERPSPFRVLELKANSELPVPQARQQLGQRHTTETPAIDIAPCTSIISVGIDVDRLGLMLVNGQPKLTAEYIQATSRVGRGAVPGLVITCYSAGKPRDRSHYESFRDYHDKFYSFVEPTSVTPGALPALERALHAALVTVIRHGGGLRQNDEARKFDLSKPDQASLVSKLELRLRQAYPEPHEGVERLRISSFLKERTRQWSEWITEGAAWHAGLVYKLQPKQTGPSLLLPFGRAVAGRIGWNTLTSMRHVDSEINLEA